LKESDIEIQILTWLNQQVDCFAFKINQSGFHDGKGWRKRTNGSLNGISDIIGIYKGKPLAVEVKNSTGTVTDEQKRFLSHYQKMGGIAFVARSLSDAINSLSKC